MEPLRRSGRRRRRRRRGTRCRSARSGGRSGLSRRRRPVPSRSLRRAGCRATRGSSRSTRTTRRRSSSVSGSAWRRGNDLSGSLRPRRRQRPGEVVLLGDQVGDAVAHPARFDEDDLGALGQHVGEQQVVVDQPRQPASMPSKWAPSASRSHCSRPHGSVATSTVGACADVVGRHQLAGREDAHLVEVVGRALVVDAEARQTVDLVAPQVDADRGVGGRRDTRRRSRRDGRTRHGARPAPRGDSRTRRVGARADPDRPTRHRVSGRMMIGSTSSRPVRASGAAPARRRRSPSDSAPGRAGATARRGAGPSSRRWG